MKKDGIAAYQQLRLILPEIRFPIRLSFKCAFQEPPAELSFPHEKRNLTPTLFLVLLYPCLWIIRPFLAFKITDVRVQSREGVA